jgi:hypothetical protein
MADFDSPDHRAWWADREEAYVRRPDVHDEILQVLDEIQHDRDERAAYEAGLEARIARGDQRAQEQLNEFLTRDAYETDPALPAAKGDPGEWAAFFRQFYGRDMPTSAYYQARLHGREADAPPDVGGLRAAYDEQPWNDLTTEAAAADDEMEAWRRGITVDELWEEQRAAEAREAAEGHDRHGLPAEFWLRPAPGSDASGPYEPADALARLQAGRTGGLSQTLLFRTSGGTLRPLIGPGGYQQFTVTGWVRNSPARGRRARQSWSGIDLGEELAWYDAVAVAERVSRLPPASHATVESDDKRVFEFADGKCVGPGFPRPDGQPGTPVEELARLMTAGARPAVPAEPRLAGTHQLGFPAGARADAAVPRLARRIIKGLTKAGRNPAVRR